jgi:tetratricopeptide (TPR) repeat protein
VVVGNCVSLTALFNILAVRAGLDVKTVLRSGHVFSSYKGAPIENTSSNLRGAYKLYDYHATAFSVVTAMYDWQNTKDVLSGQFKKIIGLQESIIAIDPKFAKPYIILGDAYLFNGEFQKSIEWFKKGLELEKDPGMRSAVYFDMGLAYIGLGEIKEAQKCFLLSFKGEKAQ